MCYILITKLLFLFGENMKYASIDIESTGLDIRKSNIIEIGIVLDDLNNRKPLKELPTYHAYISRSRYDGEAFALSMHPKIFRRIGLFQKYGKNHEEISSYHFVSPSKLAVSIKNFLINNGYETKRDKVTLNVAGKNFNDCDKQILLSDIPDLSKHLIFRSRCLDPSILFYDESDEILPSLSECLSRAGLDSRVAHTALEDAYQVVELLRYKI